MIRGIFLAVPASFLMMEIVLLAGYLFIWVL